MDLTYIKHTLTGIVNTMLQLNVGKFLMGLLTGLWLFIAGIHVYIYAIIFLTLLDVITGVWAAIHSGEQITSKKLKTGLLQKTALYLLLLVGAFMVGKVLQSVLHYEQFYIAFLLTLMISVYEMTSVIENVIKINPDLKFLQRLIGVMNVVVDKQIENVQEAIGGKSLDDKKG